MRRLLGAYVRLVNSGPLFVLPLSFAAGALAQSDHGWQGVWPGLSFMLIIATWVSLRLEIIAGTGPWSDPPSVTVYLAGRSGHLGYRPRVYPAGRYAGRIIGLSGAVRGRLFYVLLDRRALAAGSRSAPQSRGPFKPERV